MSWLYCIDAGFLGFILLSALFYCPVTCFVCDNPMFRGRDGRLHCTGRGRVGDPDAS